MEPNELDLVAAMEYYHDQWEKNDSPFALAYDYLSGIDLFGNDNEEGLKIGDLEFMCSDDINFSYNIGVTSEDPISASLLQARLIELGHNTSVEIVDGA